MNDQASWHCLLIALACVGISSTQATNLTNVEGKSNVAISATVKSADKQDKRNDTVPVILISSGDHVQDLERSLQEFDEKLLRELEQAQQERQESARQKAAVRSDEELESDSESEGEGDSEANASGEGQENNQDANESEEAQGGGTVTSTEEKNETATDSSQEQVSGTNRNGSATTQKTAIPSGDDDDIIARQLREAAEAETDPVIKEKLWIEYRKYKNQQGSNTPP